jgi:hypothetical protein
VASGHDSSLLEWLSEPTNPPIRYLTARDLIEVRPSADTLKELRDEILAWEPLQHILTMQLEDGSFPKGQKTPTAQPTFSALCLLHRCGLDVTDEPVARIIDYLTQNHLSKGALSYTTGGSGVLSCYLGVMVTALIKMGALDTDLVQSSIQWLIDHQRFDHKTTRTGGDKDWPYKAPKNYGCWDTVSCYHGVAGAFRAFAAIPPTLRSADVHQCLDDAIEYLQIHHLYKQSAADRPLVRHMTQFFLVGDYRSDLLDMLEGVADADPILIDQDWVQTAVTDMDNLTSDGRVTLVKNYGKKLIDPVPFEPIGAPSRFLTYQWLGIHNTFNSASRTPGNHHWAEQEETTA